MSNGDNGAEVVGSATQDNTNQNGDPDIGEPINVDSSMAKPVAVSDSIPIERPDNLSAIPDNIVLERTGPNFFDDDDTKRIEETNAAVEAAVSKLDVDLTKMNDDELAKLADQLEHDLPQIAARDDNLNVEEMAAAKTAPKKRGRPRKVQIEPPTTTQTSNPSTNDAATASTATAASTEAKAPPKRATRSRTPTKSAINSYLSFDPTVETERAVINMKIRRYLTSDYFPELGELLNKSAILAHLSEFSVDDCRKLHDHIKLLVASDLSGEQLEAAVKMAMQFSEGLLSRFVPVQGLTANAFGDSKFMRLLEEIKIERLSLSYSAPEQRMALHGGGVVLKTIAINKVKQSGMLGAAQVAQNEQQFSAASYAASAQNGVTGVNVAVVGDAPQVTLNGDVKTEEYRPSGSAAASASRNTIPVSGRDVPRHNPKLGTPKLTA